MFRPLAIIEPDTVSSARLRSALESAGFRTDSFREGATALTIIRKRAFALAILDLDLPGSDAFAICEEVSRIVPVVTVASDAGEETCVRALESGADDCVCRGVNERELVARVRNVLRRTEADSELQSRDLETLSLSVAEMRVRDGNSVHELSRGETEVLALLVEHAPTPLTSAQIAEMLSAGRGTVESRIKSLRKKLGGRLVTRGRFGYVLM